MKKIILNNSYAQISQDDCDDNALVLDMVWVDEAERGQGIGTQLVELAIEYAEEEGKTLGLYAEPQDDSTDQERLIAWYRRFGFKSDKECDALMSI